MNFTAFLKKEINEIFKTTKIIVLPVLFLFFGILSPLSAKYMNLLLAQATEKSGFKIVMADPTFIQSYEQLFKNLYFMMIIVTILIFAGSIAEEKFRGTAILVLTKNLSRSGFIFGKLITAMLFFTLSFAVCTAIFIYYTYLLFHEFANNGTWLALLLFWIFGIFMISLTFLASISAKSFTAAAVGGFFGYVCFSAFSILPYIGKYSPGILQALSVELVQGSKTTADAIIPMFITVALTVVAVVSGLAIFRRQEL
jgi:ABC-2 type transport system permease protein